MDTIWNHEKIIEARTAAGLDRKDAATALKITDFYLTQIEQGKKDPSIKLGLRMGNLYRQPLAHFLIPEKIFALG